MFPIVKKRVLNETVTLMEIEAPLVARKALPGQFIIFRIDEEGERIPLTIAGYDREKGTVTIIFQKVGYTTMKLDTLNEGDALLDFVGPLGEPSHTEGVKRAAVIGGGLGVAIAYPQAKALHEAGCEVDLIVGFRNEHLIILKDELAAACTDLTKPKNIKTIVSMNPIMIDGTGMCGGCRVTVGGVTKFACVDGPDFDGHQVDWAEAISRSRMFRPEEQRAMEKLHKCRLTGGVR